MLAYAVLLHVQEEDGDWVLDAELEDERFLMAKVKGGRTFGVGHRSPLRSFCGLHELAYESFNMDLWVLKPLLSSCSNVLAVLIGK